MNKHKFGKNKEFQIAYAFQLQNLKIFIYIFGLLFKNKIKFSFMCYDTKKLVVVLFRLTGGDFLRGSYLKTVSTIKLHDGRMEAKHFDDTEYVIVDDRSTSKV